MLLSLRCTANTEVTILVIQAKMITILVISSYQWGTHYIHNSVLAFLKIHHFIRESERNPDSRAAFLIRSFIASGFVDQRREHQNVYPDLVCQFYEKAVFCPKFPARWSIALVPSKASTARTVPRLTTTP